MTVERDTSRSKYWQWSETNDIQKAHFHLLSCLSRSLWLCTEAELLVHSFALSRFQSCHTLTLVCRNVTSATVYSFVYKAFDCIERSFPVLNILRYFISPSLQMRRCWGKVFYGFSRHFVVRHLLFQILTRVFLRIGAIEHISVALSEIWQTIWLLLTQFNVILDTAGAVALLQYSTFVFPRCWRPDNSSWTFRYYDAIEGRLLRLLQSHFGHGSEFCRSSRSIIVQLIFQCLLDHIGIWAALDK